MTSLTERIFRDPEEDFRLILDTLQSAEKHNSANMAALVEKVAELNNRLSCHFSFQHFFELFLMEIVEEPDLTDAERRKLILFWKRTINKLTVSQEMPQSHGRA